MKACQSENAPNTEEANNADDETGRRVLDCLDEGPVWPLALLGEQDQVRDGTGENKDAMQGQGQ